MKILNKRRISNRRYSIESDSLTSFFLPWTKNRAPPIYPNAQTGRTVTLNELFLFFSAVILLVSGVGLLFLSIWILISKKIYDLLECRADLAFFALPVVILSLPISWLIFAIHNDKKSRKYSPLILILLLFCIILTIIGIYVGFSHKLNLKVGQISPDPVLVGFERSLRQSINDQQNSKIWKDIETRFGCCWIDKNVQSSCRVNNTTTGCTEIIVSSLAVQTRLFSGIDCVALFLQSCVFLIVTIIFLRGKGHDED